MVYRPTLSELRSRALDTADMTDGFSVEARTNDYINTALSKLHRMICDANEDYIISKKQITIASGTEEYALPSNFYKMVKVFWLDGSSRRYVLDRYEHRKADGHNTAQQSGTVELWYAPQFERLMDDDATVHISMPVGWDDYAVLAAATRLMIKEESDASQVMALQSAALQDIMDSVEPRDMGEPGQIEDYYRRWSNDFIYGRDRVQDLRYRLVGNNISLVEFSWQGV